MRSIMSLTAAGALLLSACTSSPERGPEGQGSDRTAGTASIEYFAYEYSWREQTTSREYVEQPYVCQGVIYCENPFPSGQWVTVPGPVVTKTDFVCATSLDEARLAVPTDATVTGNQLDPALCAQVEEQPQEEVDESEAGDLEGDQTEVPDSEVEADQYDVDEEAAIEEYEDEAQMYDREWLAGYSEPLSVALADEERGDVRKVQRWLRQQGFSPGAVDGYYGKATDQAVRRFQRYAGLSVDGVVGEDTWSALSQGWGY